MHPHGAYVWCLTPNETNTNTHPKKYYRPFSQKTKNRPQAPGSGVANACEVIPWLHNHTKEEVAIASKLNAAGMYAEIEAAFNGVGSLPAVVKQHVLVTARYGRLLAGLVYQGFVVLLEATKPGRYRASPWPSTGTQAEEKNKTALRNTTRLCEAAAAYNATKQAYEDLWVGNPGVCPTLYTDETWWYGPKPPGLGADVRRFQNELCT